MKVETPGITRRITTAKTVKKAGATGLFSLETSENVASFSDTAPVHVTPTLSGLFELQEAPAGIDPERSRKRGDQLLARLDLLRHALMSGSLGRDTLYELKSAVRTPSHATEDPRLNEIILEIEQRVAIELAKIEMSEEGRE